MREGQELRPRDQRLPRSTRAYACMASRMRFTADQLTQQLAKSGVNATTLKARIKADIDLGADRARAIPVEPADRRQGYPLARWTRNPSDTVGYDYTHAPDHFPGAARDRRTAFIEARKREAEALRGAFRAASEGIAFARALQGRRRARQVIRSSADIPAGAAQGARQASRSASLTPPEVTKVGVEMFAIVRQEGNRRPTTRRASARPRENLMAKRYEQRSKQYLEEIVAGAMIEYK